MIPFKTTDDAKLLFWIIDMFWLRSPCTKKQSWNENGGLNPPQMRGLPFKTPPTDAHLTDGAFSKLLQEMLGLNKSITSEVLAVSCPSSPINPVVTRILSYPEMKGEIRKLFWIERGLLGLYIGLVSKMFF